ncbi:hypothetical protein NPIL_382631 [Nephila pilipes]|uniref:Uncharacterized protein n=1 Tax=Nephila pilipes TaxID=299642 RepID=A0A8X6TVV6_NEPPI|nr:hypothetical protein NPIL_382631 [Nephila pilipes]
MTSNSLTINSKGSTFRNGARYATVRMGTTTATWVCREPQDVERCPGPCNLHSTIARIWVFSGTYDRLVDMRKFKNQNMLEIFVTFIELEAQVEFSMRQLVIYFHLSSAMCHSVVIVSGACSTGR